MSLNPTRTMREEAAAYAQDAERFDAWATADSAADELAALIATGPRRFPTRIDVPDLIALAARTAQLRDEWRVALGGEQ
jgi:hypothetical protein